MKSVTSAARGSLWHLVASVCGVLTLQGRYHKPGGFLDRSLTILEGSGASRADPTAAAIKRWDGVRRAAPAAPIGYYRLAANLRKAGESDRASAVIEEALVRFPDDLGTTIEAARLADQASDYAAAVTHWDKAARIARPRSHWLASAAGARILLGRFDEAEALVAKARARFPRHVTLMAIECMLASSRQNWPKAVAMWTEFNRRHPNYPNAWESLGLAVHGTELHRMERADPVPTAIAPQDVGRVEDDALRDLLLGFESIGENCEFGLVQRRFGAEPLSLLRWNLVWAENLIEALKADLDGLGDPENTRMEVMQTGEFFVSDTRWYLGMHTYVFAGQATHDMLYPKLCQRMALLKGRFLADLAAAEKIFVHCAPCLSKGLTLALHAALRRFGPVRLLVVLPVSAESASGADGRPGEVLVAAPGLLIGFVRRLGVTADGSWDIAFDDWIAICRKAAALPRS